MRVLAELDEEAVMSIMIFCIVHLSNPPDSGGEKGGSGNG
jgi:hypothetical protein